MKMTSIRLCMRVHANYIQTTVRFNYTPLEYQEFAFGGASYAGQIMRIQTGESLYSLVAALLYKAQDVPVKEGMIGFAGYLFVDLLFENVDDLRNFTVMELRYVDPSRGGEDLAQSLQNTYVPSTLRHKLVQTLFTMIEARNVEAIKAAISGMRKAR